MWDRILEGEDSRNIRVVLRDDIVLIVKEKKLYRSLQIYKQVLPITNNNKALIKVLQIFYLWT